MNSYRLLAENLFLESRFPSRSEMRKIDSLRELRKLAEYYEDDKLFVRWSNGPKADYEMGGKSYDYKQEFRHEGLSAVKFDPNWPTEDVIEILTDYGGPAMGIDTVHINQQKFPWIFTGEKIGRDSDGHALVDMDTIQVIGVLSQEFLEKLKEYVDAEMKAMRGKREDYPKPEEFDIEV